MGLLFIQKFWPATSLTIITSYLLELASLSPTSLSSQGQTLNHLVLSKNELTYVPSEAIKPLRNLDHLNLNDNKISSLQANSFDGLSKVRDKSKFGDVSIWYNLFSFTFLGDPINLVQ